MDATAPSLLEPADAELIERYFQGDAGAFELLTNRYYRPVSGFLYRRVQRFEVVEDLAQETFLEALRSLRAGRRPEQFASWLFTIARNCAGKWLRRKRPQLFDPDAPPVDLPAPSEQDLREEMEEQKKQFAELERELGKLPEQTRRLLEQKHLRGKTCEQIAAEEGQPVGTLKSLLSRAYQLLRTRLGKRGET